MARATTKQETAQVEFNPAALSVEELLALLAQKSNGKSLVEIEYEAQENKIRAIKTSFYDAVNVESVIAALTQFGQITLSLENDNIIMAEYGKAVPVTVIPEKGARILKTSLIVNDKEGNHLFDVKGNYDRQLINILEQNIPECSKKAESYIRDYFRDHKDQVCNVLHTIDPVRYVIPA